MKLKLAFGAMSRRLSEQLDSQEIKYKTEDVLHFQLDADAITRLRVRGLLSDGETDKVRRKLTKRITDHINQQQ